MYISLLPCPRPSLQFDLDAMNNDNNNDKQQGDAQLKMECRATADVYVWGIIPVANIESSLISRKVTIPSFKEVEGSLVRRWQPHLERFRKKLTARFNLQDLDDDDEGLKEDLREVGYSVLL